MKLKKKVSKKPRPACCGLCHTELLKPGKFHLWNYSTGYRVMVCSPCLKLLKQFGMSCEQGRDFFASVFERFIVSNG